MIYTRYGKCTVCKKPTKQKQEFMQTINMFDKDSNLINEVQEQLTEWRNQPLYCELHCI